MAERPEDRSVQPTVSPDGKYVWDGHSWVQNPVATQPARTQYARPGGVRVAPGSAKLPATHTTRNVVLLAVVAGILFVGGCLAVVGGAVGRFQEQAASRSVTYDMRDFDSRGMTHVVAEGDRFSMLFLRYRPGWSLSGDGRGHATILGLEAFNQRSETARPAVLFHLLDGGREVGAIRCTAPPVPSAGEAKLRCSSKDARPTAYSRIRVESLR
jgi:hypothetical protein